MTDAYLIEQIDRYTQRETPVVVLGRFGMEYHYYRVKLPCGRVTVANDSMLRVKAPEPAYRFTQKRDADGCLYLERD